ncbi:receptor-type tyrosine-protein phosphatase F [Echria macrotheca]|uniref:Receptor-type tyrosine-protein phosphatase F n=1 Tax=Echria macrotheca TaxID=438768 RepID=A0AAJ0FAQ9_9PEZI|nr:receptor-type tyrosine-protein phosphatase F [Echria macrotheca]
MDDAVKIMVVGDSISHGRQGDWTWRYRLWQWLGREGVAATFVGPYRGTVPPDDPEPPRPPPLASDPPRPGFFRTDGGYAEGVSPRFLANSHHFAVSGRQAMQAKELIAEQIATYQPDVCLVELGFNDMAWFVSGPHDTLASMEQLVRQARSAKPDLQFAIANVPHRTFLPGREDLPANTNEYNALLARAIPAWSTPESPIALVRFCENYGGGGEHVADATYDGIHPNALGEFQLAQAFTRTLIADFRIGRRELSIPTSVPRRPTPTPARVKASPAPSGVVVTWDAVYGAFWYDVRIRLAGSESWTVVPVSCNRYDTTFCVSGQRWEYQVRTCGGNTVKSSWSEVVSAVADPQTLPAPSRIRTHATADGFNVTWEPFPEGLDVDRYGVLAFDEDYPGAFPYVVGIKGSGGRVSGLVPGHRYGVAVQTWSTAGGGLPGGARAVTVCRGTPLPPVRLQLTVLDRTTAELEWMGDPAAAGYRVWVRRTGTGVEIRSEVADSTNASTSSLSTKALLRDLYPSVWEFEFSVSAYNGNDESDVSQWVVAPRPVESSHTIDLAEVHALHISLAYSPPP